MKQLLFRLLLVAALAGSATLAVAAGLSNRSVPTVEPAAQPTARVDHVAWSPQIAFQYYQTTELDAAFVAQHVDWLMLRYGAEKLRDEVQSYGYSNVLPQYLVLFQIAGPGPYTNENQSCRNDYTPTQNNVLWTDDFCEKVHSHESWFLHNGAGERLYTEERNWDGKPIYEYYMNPASEGFRDFWVAQVRRQQHAGWNSFFLDNVAATYSYLETRPDNNDGEVKEYQSEQDWQNGVLGLLQHIRASFPAHQVWGNIITTPATADAWNRYRGALDGIQEENFATNWANQPPLTAAAWQAMLQRAEQTLAEGKSVVLYGQGDENDFSRMRFSLASYLLVATPDNRATFRYTHTSDYERLRWYPEYELDLGLPQSNRRQEGGLWVRGFACGQVIVDPQRQQGTITLHACRTGA